MSSTREIYQHHLRKQFAPTAYAVWPPGRALQLGDVVSLGHNGDFRKQADLRQLALEMAVETGQPQSISATSVRVREAIARASGALATTGGGGASAWTFQKGAR